jgi:hypothetical protein
MGNHNSTGTFKTVLGTRGAEKERSVSRADVEKDVGHSPDAKEHVATAITNKANTKNFGYSRLEQLPFRVILG